MKTFNAITGLLAGAIMLATLPLSAQQVPLVTGYAFQTHLANPAEKGTHNSPVSVIYRNQWIGFGEDSPLTINLDADLSGLLGIKNLGVGFRVIHDEAHIIHRNNLNFDFSYHLISTPTFLLSAGVNAGILQQRVDFDETRVNNEADLAFAGVDNKMRFDGGPSVFLRVGERTGSHFKAGAFLPQLFSSDFAYQQGTLQMQPHLQGYAGYRYQTDAFGLEPIAFTRMIFGEFDCKCTSVDLMLRAFFLENVFWVGGGYGMRFGAGPGSFSGAFGVSLMNQRLQISALAESTGDFGISYEVGLSYGLKDKPAPPRDLLDKLSRNSKESDGIMLQTRTLLTSVPQQLSKAGAEFDKAKKSSSKKQMRDDVRESLEFLELAKPGIDELANKRDRLQSINFEAGQFAQKYEMQKNKEVVNIQKDFQQLNDRTNEFQSKYQSLKREIDDFARTNNLEVVDIMKDDDETVRDYFQAGLDQLAGKPVDTRPVAVRSSGQPYVEVEFKFPYNELAYNVGKDSKLADVKTMADHVAAVVADLESKGLRVHSVLIQGSLQSGKSDLNFSSGVRYAGDLGSKTLKLEYPFASSEGNRAESPQTKSLTTSRDLDFEELSALQMFALKDYLDQRTTLKKDQTKIRLYGPVSSNEYFLETSIIIKLEK